MAQREHRFNEAREAYLRALRVDPDAIAARYNLAVLTRDAGAIDEARHHLDVLLERHPDNLLAQSLRSQLVMR